MAATLRPLNEAPLRTTTEMLQRDLVASRFVAKTTRKNRESE
jgi:hypothetical protein